MTLEKKKLSKFLAFDIGCIECGEASDVVGIFDTKKEAEKECQKAEKEQAKDWHGQHKFEVFEI